MGFLFIFILIFIGLIAYNVFQDTRGNIQKAKEEYDEALDFLERNPEDSKSRVLTLEKGRVYYGLINPDVNIVGQKSGSIYSITNNTAGREAQINADIEARIGHLKIKKS